MLVFITLVINSLSCLVPTTGSSDVVGTREEAAMQSDGLSKAINGRMHARGSEREVTITSGGSSPLLGASEDQ